MARPRKHDQLQLNDDLTCDDRIVHVDAVRDARSSMPAGEALAELRELFAALSDATRLRIVAALVERELCVCDLAAATGTSESAVSHHLRLMRQLGLVRSRREGRLVYYTLDDGHVSELFRQGVDHASHHIKDRKS